MRTRAALLLALAACSGEAPEELRLAAGDLGEGRVGESYRATIAANRTVEWDVRGVPDGLVLTTDGASAELSGVPIEAGVFEIDVTVTAGEATTGRVYVLVVREGALAITTEALPEADVMMPYSATVEATGGRGTRTWTVEGLPEGLTATRDEAVTISGTPESPGAFDVRVAVRDVREGTDEQTFTLRVRASALTITTTELPVAFAGVDYVAAIESAGGRPPYQWTVTEGPEDFAVDASTTATTSLVGTTATTGRYTITVQVEDAEGERATATFDLDVSDGPLTVLTSTLTDAQLGVPYGTMLRARGGVGELEWSLASGALPDGITLDTALGRLDGTATELGRSTFTVSVTDERDRTASAALSLFVSEDPPLMITTLALPSVEVGLSVELSIEATGGATPYTWLVDGTMPTGLQIDDLGTPRTFVRGVPTRLERKDVEVTVLDRNGRRASRVFTLQITPSTVPLEIVTTEAPDGAQCRDYLFTLAGAGGSRTDFSWSIAQGSLPDGLTFDPGDGVVIGVPQVAGSFPIVLALEDGVGETTSAAVTIDVMPSSGPRYGLAVGFNASQRRLFPIDLCTDTFLQAASINQPTLEDYGLGLAAPVIFSPSGDRAAYVAQENGDERVYVVDLSGSTPTYAPVSAPLFLSFGGAFLSWSPTGQHLGFVAAPEPNHYVAYVADVSDPANPGTPRQVSPLRADVDVGSNVVWSPDGQRFAFLADTGPNAAVEVLVGQVQSSTVASPVSGPIGPGQQIRQFDPVWSSDGTHVFFVARLREPRIEVFAVDVGAPNPTPFPIAPNAPSFSGIYTPLSVAPDGERFVYVASQTTEGVYDAYLVELRSPPYVPVRVGPGLSGTEVVSRLVWSDASDQLLYLVPASGVGAGALYVTPTATPTVAVLIDGPTMGDAVRNSVGGFAFDSSGTRVAYLRDHPFGEYEPYVVDLSSGTPTPPARVGPPPGGKFTNSFRWARDAPRIVLSTRGNTTVGPGELLIVDLADGAPGRTRVLAANLNAPPRGDLRLLHLRAAGAIVYFSAGSSPWPLFGAYTAGASVNGALLSTGIYSLDQLYFPR